MDRSLLSLLFLGLVATSTGCAVRTVVRPLDLDSSEIDFREGETVKRLVPAGTQDVEPREAFVGKTHRGDEIAIGIGRKGGELFLACMPECDAAPTLTPIPMNLPGPVEEHFPEPGQGLIPPLQLNVYVPGGGVGKTLVRTRGAPAAPYGHSLLLETPRDWSNVVIQQARPPGVLPWVLVVVGALGMIVGAVDLAVNTGSIVGPIESAAGTLLFTIGILTLKWRVEDVYVPPDRDPALPEMVAPHLPPAPAD